MTVLPEDTFRKESAKGGRLFGQLKGRESGPDTGDMEQDKQINEVVFA